MPYISRLSRSTIVLSALLAIVVIAGAIGIVLLLNQKNTLSEDLDNQKITNRSLQEQLAQAQATSTPSPTPTPSPVSFSVKEFGVSFTVPSAISDLIYKYDAAIPSTSFSSTSLVKADSACSQASSSLGALSRIAKGKTPGGAQGAKVATVGAFDYYYEQPQADCSTNSSINQTQQSDYKALQTALASLK